MTFWRRGRARGVQEDTGWIAPTFAGAWVNFGSPYSTCAYRRIDGKVILKGLVKSGSNNSNIFTLPVGFRPPEDLGPLILAADGQYGFVTVKSDGSIFWQAGTGTSGYVSLDQLKPFPADL